MREYSIRRCFTGFLCVVGMNLGSITSIHSMDSDEDNHLKPCYTVRISTQIKSEAVQSILKENYNKISFFYKNGDEKNYQRIGKFNVEDIEKGLGQRIALGQIEVPLNLTAITFFLHYHDPEGKGIYDSCLYHYRRDLEKIPLVQVRKGKEIKPLSAVRIDLDLNSYPREVPLRGTILTGYNKPNFTPTIVSDYLVGGAGITETMLELAKDLVNENKKLQITLGKSRKSSYVEDSSDDKDDFWAPSSLIMYAFEMMKEVAGLTSQETLTPPQKEVILKYLVHIHKCDRSYVDKLRKSLGMD